MNNRTLIAGGYGTVGSHAARNLRAAGFQGELLLAGRNPDKGVMLASELSASALAFDNSSLSSALEITKGCDVVVAAMKDPRGFLLEAAMHQGAAFIGITQSPDSVAQILFRVRNKLPRRPIVTLGHWQAGITTHVATYLAQVFLEIKVLQIAALYDRKDPVGPMVREETGDFMARALIRHDGVFKWVDPRATTRTVERAPQEAFTAAPMSVLDVTSLAGLTNAPNVRVDIGIGDSRGTAAGKKASHDLHFELEGQLLDGGTGQFKAVLSDPNGQAHLTSIGIVLAIEGLAKAASHQAVPGVWQLPETLVNPRDAIERLKKFGVSLSELPIRLNPA